MCSKHISKMSSKFIYSAEEDYAFCNSPMWKEFDDWAQREMEKEMGEKNRYSAAEYDSVCNDLMWAQYDIEEQTDTLTAFTTIQKAQREFIEEQAAEINALKKAIARRDREITRLREDSKEMHVVAEKALEDAVKAEDKRKELKANAAILEEELKQTQECFYAAMSEVEDGRLEKHVLEKRIESLETTAAAARTVRFKVMDERDSAKRELAAMTAEVAEKRLKGKAKAANLIQRLEAVVEKLESNRKVKRA